MIPLGEYLLSYQDDKRNGALEDLGNVLESFVNALYLIRLDRREPGKVLEWLELADIDTQRMGHILEHELGR
jgi:hypothetical protein